MPVLLRELAAQEGVAPVSHAAADAAAEGSDGGGRPPGGRRAFGADGFGSRVALARPDGTHWAGPLISPGEPGLIERPVRVGATVVALVRMRPVPAASEANERQFLRSQYVGLLATAGALLMLALASALWLARSWVRALGAVQTATARIADGELDVRVRIERSDEIGDVVRNVNAMADSLQRIEGARRRWLADLSHELRTPLTVLRGDIEALVDGVRPLGAQAMTRLRDEVLHLSVLVEDLHLLALSDLQTLRCQFTHADAVHIVQRTLDRHARSAAAAGLTLTWPGPPPPAMMVRCDVVRMEQLLGNLVQNSVRYTDAPGRIEIGLQPGPAGWAITVDDSAPGVPEADLGRVFEPLYRAEGARNRHGGGSGLGLAICAAIVQAHRGGIRAQPSALGGLRVRVELPAELEGQAL